MDMSVFLSTLLATDNPALPGFTVMRVSLHVEWALVLGSAVMLIGGKLARRYRWGLCLLVMAWTLFPGSASPAYWLGLAFQTPSFTSAVICLGWLISRVRREAAPENTGTPAQGGRLPLFGAAGIVLGWVLLLDTLAWWPVSVYAWGFGSAALALVAVVAMLFWAMSGKADRQRLVPGLTGPVLLLTVLTLFVLTRLPTGNVWDALMDPCLWVALQVGWVVSALRRWRASR